MKSITALWILAIINLAGLAYLWSTQHRTIPGAHFASGRALRAEAPRHETDGEYGGDRIDR